jgi:hypothetical protein
MLEIMPNENIIDYNYYVSQNQISISHTLPLKVSTINLYSSTGKKLQEYLVKTNSTAQLIDLPTNLAVGIYILSVGQSSFKFNISQ